MNWIHRLLSALPGWSSRWIEFESNATDIDFVLQLIVFSAIIAVAMAAQYPHPAYPAYPAPHPPAYPKSYDYVSIPPHLLIVSQSLRNC